MMNELPYFYFVVMAAPQLWPYYVEIPYAAWPDEAMYYNSNGTCQQPYDRAWSYLDVMNWETHENIIVCDAKGFSADQVEQTRLMLEEELDIWTSDDLLSLTHVYRLLLHLLDAIPREYCEPSNVVVSSFRCAKPQLVAAVARLFMRRLQSNAVWDRQTGNLLTLKQLVDLYLEGFPLEASDSLADEAQQVFSEGEAWHRAHPDVQIGWWKTLAQVREAIKG
jgi:hypothetical protein